MWRYAAAFPHVKRFRINIHSEMNDIGDVNKSKVSMSCVINVNCNIWVENPGGLFVTALVEPTFVHVISLNECMLFLKQGFIILLLSALKGASLSFL